MKFPLTDELQRQQILFYKLINGYLAIGWIGAFAYGVYAFGKWLFT